MVKPVSDIYDYWTKAPPAPSERLRYWVEQIDRGWRPNRRIGGMGYADAARFYGVYVYEYLRVIAGLLSDTPGVEQDAALLESARGHRSY